MELLAATVVAVAIICASWIMASEIQEAAAKIVKAIRESKEK